MKEKDIEQIADAARTVTADSSDYVEPEVIVEPDNARDYREQD